MSSKSNPEVKLIPIGGLGEIGLNCMVLETQESMIVVDCGVLFTELEKFGIDYIIPDFNYILEKKDKLKGFVITHAHEDHIGALKFAFRVGVEAPIYCTPFASCLVESRLAEAGVLRSNMIQTRPIGSEIELGDFTVKTVPVNHSIIEALALVIDTPVGTILHTGDFKIDTDPYYGKPLDLDVFKKLGEKGVHLLMSDSTNVERESENLAEKTLENTFTDIMSESKGLTIFSMFSSNVARVAQILDVARKFNKKVVLTGRSMISNVDHARETGYLKGSESVLVSMDEFERHDRDKLIVLSAGSQGEYKSSLARIALGEHSRMEVYEGDLVVFSSRAIPGNEKAISRTINNLFRQGAEVLYHPIRHTHISGHASKPELKKMLEAVRPNFFLPVHGEYRHLVHHGRLAESTGVKPSNVMIATNGEMMRLTKDRFEKFGELETTEGFVCGGKNIITKSVLKQRRQLAEAGALAFSLDASNRRRGPDIEILAKGLYSNDEAEEKLIELEDYLAGVYEASRPKAESLEETVEDLRIHLRRRIASTNGSKPVVFPFGTPKD